MESKLVQWIQEYHHTYAKYPLNQTIVMKAQSLSTCEGFKASKGWLCKFITRNSFINR